MKRFAVLTLLLAGCASPADDLNAICEEVKNPELTNETPDMRATALATNIDARLKSDPIRRAWNAVAAAPADQRYKLMQAAATETGVEGWSCPELEALWSASAPPEESPAEEPPAQPPAEPAGTHGGGTNGGGSTNGGEPMPPG